MHSFYFRGMVSGWGVTDVKTKYQSSRLQVFQYFFTELHRRHTLQKHKIVVKEVPVCKKFYS